MNARVVLGSSSYPNYGKMTKPTRIAQLYCICHDLWPKKILGIAKVIWWPFPSAYVYRNGCIQNNNKKQFMLAFDSPSLPNP